VRSGKPCCAGLERWLSPALFKALADPNRVAILVALSDGGRERTVSDVAACCPVDLSVVSRHLRTLRDAGVLDARKQGKEVLYRVRFDALVAMLRNLADALQACCPPATSGDLARVGGPSRARKGGDA
jgi:DNA-binding transcriptional ArsR family regulator